MINLEKKAIGNKSYLYPYPVTLVGADVEGKPNFMTIGFIGISNANPGMVTIGSFRKHYTNRGILANKTFSVNPSEDMLEVVDFIGLNSGEKIDKSKIFDVFYGKLKNAPMIKACPLNLECSVLEVLNKGGLDHIIIGEIMYGLMFGSYIFVGSKDLIWVYKRSPRTIRALVYSYLLAMLIFNLLIALGLTIFFSFILKFDVFNIIFFFAFYLINSEVAISQAVGIQCLSPAFEEKGSAMTSNNLFLMILQLIPFQFILLFIIIAFPVPTSPVMARFHYLMPLLLISIATAVPLLFLGLRKLNRIE